MKLILSLVAVLIVASISQAQVVGTSPNCPDGRCPLIPAVFQVPQPMAPNPNFQVKPAEVRKQPVRDFLRRVFGCNR
jgi:hypothetical protein